MKKQSPGRRDPAATVLSLSVFPVQLITPHPLPPRKQLRLAEPFFLKPSQHGSPGCTCLLKLLFDDLMTAQVAVDRGQPRGQLAVLSVQADPGSHTLGSLLVSSPADVSLTTLPYACWENPQHTHPGKEALAASGIGFWASLRTPGWSSQEALK